VIPSVSKDTVTFIFKGKQLFDCLPMAEHHMPKDSLQQHCCKNFKS